VCAVVLIAGSEWLLRDQLVTRGTWSGSETERAEDAAWESRWLASAGAFSVEGGELVAKVLPGEQLVRATWKLRGVRAAGGALHAELPSQVELPEVTVQGSAVAPQQALEHVMIPLGPCATEAAGCEVVLQVEKHATGWPLESQAPLIHASQVWLRATDVLPRLGTDPERALRAPAVRQAHGLQADIASVLPAAATPAHGVTTRGTWTYSIEAPPGWSLGDKGSLEGPFDFAFAWRPEAPERYEDDGVRVWHGPSHAQTARDIAQDLGMMQMCLSQRAPWPMPAITAVMQAPREQALGVHDGVLWLPEDEGWDVTSEGLGRIERRMSIARALAASSVAAQAQLAREAGSRWLDDGVAGWLALSCVRAHAEEEQWHALMNHVSDELVLAFGALDAPIRGFARDADAAWIEHYAPLATFSWAMTLGEQEASARVSEILASLRQGESVQVAMRAHLGEAQASRMLAEPLASDASVALDEARQLRTQAKRWRWEEGGWREVEGSTHIVASFSEESRVVETSSPLPSETPLTVFDAWPSFERSILDNTWSPEAN